MMALLAVPVMAILGHIRGQWNERLPLFHPRFWCLPFVFAISWAFLPLWMAAGFTASWLLQNWPAWGRWFDLNNVIGQVRDPPNWFERMIERVPGDDLVHFTVRNTLLALPLAFLSPWLILLGPLQTAAYWIGWAVYDPGNQPAEWITGALWGAAIVFLTIS